MFLSTKVKWIILLLVIFVAGGSFGFLAGQFYQKYEFQKMRRNRGNPQRSLINNMKKELNLTEQQTEKISDILENSRKRMEVEMTPVRKKLREEVTKDIDAVLTQEQIVKHAKFRDRMETERRRRFGSDSTGQSRDSTQWRRRFDPDTTGQSNTTTKQVNKM